jgi:hypothetical protein
LNHILYQRVGRVVEVVQIAGSPAERAGKADFVLIMRGIPGEAHDIYKMRRVSLIHGEHHSVLIQVLRLIYNARWKLLTLPQDIKCTINVQHNCADNKCQSMRTRVIFNEREETAHRALEVQHIHPDDLIINTGQMRDAAALSPFRIRPTALTTSAVIRGAAERAFAAREAQKKSKATPTDAEPEEIEGEPSRKKSKQSGPPAMSISSLLNSNPNIPRVPSGLRHTSSGSTSR